MTWKTVLRLIIVMRLQMEGAGWLARIVMPRKWKSVRYRTERLSVFEKWALDSALETLRHSIFVPRHIYGAKVGDTIRFRPPARYLA